MEEERKQDQNTKKPTKISTKLDKANIHNLAFELDNLNQEEEEEEEEEENFSPAIEELQPWILKQYR